MIVLYFHQPLLLIPPPSCRQGVHLSRRPEPSSGGSLGWSPQSRATATLSPSPSRLPLRAAHPLACTSIRRLPSTRIFSRQMHRRPAAGAFLPQQPLLAQAAPGLCPAKAHRRTDERSSRVEYWRSVLALERAWGGGSRATENKEDGRRAKKADDETNAGGEMEREAFFITHC